MSEFNKVNVEDNPRGEAYLTAFAKAREAFDIEEAIEEEAARYFNVTVDYIRTGHLTPRIANWIKGRRIEAGWEYLEK